MLIALSLFALFWLIPTHTGEAAGDLEVAPGFFSRVAASALLVLSVLLVGHRLIRFPKLRNIRPKTGGGAVLTEIAVLAAGGLLIAWALGAVGYLFVAPAVMLAACWRAANGAGGLLRWWLPASPPRPGSAPICCSASNCRNGPAGTGAGRRHDRAIDRRFRQRADGNQPAVHRAGITLGIVIGVIPGLGSVTALAVLIPITFYMSPLAAIAFLVGVNKGGTSGGAIPAILLNSPGTPEAAATALDGHPMAKRGEAQRALKFALFSSVTGDTISDVLLIVLVVPFAAIALQFGPLEYTAVLLFAFALLSGISGDSRSRG